MPLAALAGIGVAGSIGGALIGSNAANNAAAEQAQAANHAADLQYQASQNALGFQKEQYNQGQQNLAPWLNSGTGALSNLDYMMGISPRSPSSFTGASPGMTNTPSGTTPQGGMPTQQAYAGSPTSGAQLAGPSMGMPTTPGLSPTAGPHSVQQANGGMPMQQAYGSPSSGAVLASGGLHTAGMPSSSPALEPTPGQAPGMAPSPTSGAVPSSGGFGSLMQPYSGTFTAPTGLTEQNDPGYQARLQLGTDALQRSAAARGGVLTGGTARDLNQYAQDYASNEYGNVYNRALQNFDTNYNVYNQNQANQFNRLAALSGVGQQTAGQLGAMGQNASNAISSNLLGTAGQMGQDYQNAGAANASGYVGAANAYGSALGGIGGNLSNLYLMQKLIGGGGNPYAALYNAQQPSGLSTMNPAITEGVY